MQPIYSEKGHFSWLRLSTEEGLGQTMRFYTTSGNMPLDGLQALSRMLAHSGHGSKICPLCDENDFDPKPIGHLLRVLRHR